MQARFDVRSAPLTGGCCSARARVRMASASVAQGRLRSSMPRRVARTHASRPNGMTVRAQHDDASADGSSSGSFSLASSTTAATPGAPPFNWLRAWYAVGLVDALAPDLPQSQRILGIPMAIWHDGGEWRAVHDVCPHRLAPLSEGRVAEDGTLQVRARAGQPGFDGSRHSANAAAVLCPSCCARAVQLPRALATRALPAPPPPLTVPSARLQGWSFDGHGACVCVPQDAPSDHGRATSTAAGAQRAARSPRAAAAAFPTAVAQGLLYVWPTAGDFEAARAAPLPLVPGLDGAPGGPRVVERGVPYVRDLLYGLDTLVENLADPGHVAWAHHGIVARSGVVAAGPAPADARATAWLVRRATVTTHPTRLCACCNPCAVKGSRWRRPSTSGAGCRPTKKEATASWCAPATMRTDTASGFVMAEVRALTHRLPAQHTYKAPGVFLIEQQYETEVGEAPPGALNFHTAMTPVSPGVTRIVLRTARRPAVLHACVRMHTP